MTQCNDRSLKKERLSSVCSYGGVVTICGGDEALADLLFIVQGHPCSSKVPISNNSFKEQTFTCHVDLSTRKSVSIASTENPSAPPVFSYVSLWCPGFLSARIFCSSSSVPLTLVLSPYTLLRISRVPVQQRVSVVPVLADKTGTCAVWPGVQLKPPAQSSWLAAGPPRKSPGF